jgi:hypothetical protein
MTVSNPENTPQPNIDTQKTVDPNLNQQSISTNEPEKSEDPNWRAFREARKQDRVHREAAEKLAQEKGAEAQALKAAMDALLNKGNQQQPQQQYSYQEEETEDQRIERKVLSAIAQREQAAAQERQQREREEYPTRLQQHFPDFQQTIANENLDYLDYHYPEVTAAFKMLPDGYDKWHHIYKAIKKFIPNQPHAKQDSARADNNFNKPKSMSSAGVVQSNTGEGSANVLSAERKAENWKRMQAARKGVN